MPEIHAVENSTGDDTGIIGSEKHSRLGALTIIRDYAQWDIAGHLGDKFLLSLTCFLGLPGKIPRHTGAPHPTHMAAVNANIVFSQFQGQVVGRTGQGRLCRL